MVYRIESLSFSKYGIQNGIKQAMEANQSVYYTYQTCVEVFSRQFLTYCIAINLCMIYPTCSQNQLRKAGLILGMK